MSTLLSFTLYGSLVTWPLYLQQVMGYPALQAGLAMAPRGLATMTSMFFVGQLYGKIDTRLILASGFLLVALGSYRDGALHDRVELLDAWCGRRWSMGSAWV